MADSAITKKTLARALKKLMLDCPFSKISISDICDLCGMNRKSFYYHFRDKYDLVNWIFDTEFVDFARGINDTETVLRMLCGYLHSNREFYKRALRIEGQNSLRSHFCEVVLEYVSRCRISEDRGDTELYLLHTRFISDGFICALERWITEQDSASPEQFCSQLCSLYTLYSTKIN